MRFVNKIKHYKKTILILVLFFASFLFGSVSKATFWDTVQGHLLDGISVIIFGIIKVVGWLIGFFVGMLIPSQDGAFSGIIGFNNFINAGPVIIGWEIIRDICNMGFVIVLLIIAIASILQIQTYHYRTWLPKLVLMAILINFSKLICGILIDASQIVTLTFASGIQQIGPGNFMDALGINHFLDMDFSKTYAKEKIGDDNGINALNIFATLMLILALACIALIVVAAITIVFAIRIVALWILIILSPFAYLFSASPMGHQYASQWWQKFSQWVVVGPVMVFFIWLSLTTIRETMSEMFSTMPEGGVPVVGLTEIGSPETLAAFILACCMLMASLVVAQQLGGYAARIAGGAYNKITSTGDQIVSGGLGIAKWGALKAARTADTAQMKAQEGAASVIAGLSGDHFGKNYRAKSANYRMIGAGWKAQEAKKMQDYEVGKAGAWQDTFDRTLATTVRNPFQIRSVRKNIKKLTNENEKIDNAISKNDYSDDAISKLGITDQKSAEKKVAENEKAIRVLSREKTTLWGQEVKPMNEMIERKRKVSEEHGNVNKEDLDEDGLVNAYMKETDKSKKKAYFQHIVGINAVNTLMSEMDKNFDFENIKTHLDDTFGEDAGEVAADMGRIAETKGNYALMGFSKRDLRTGKAILTQKEERQAKMANIKSSESYDQSFSRNVHTDSFVTRDKNQNPNGLSLGGKKLLEGIATTDGRRNEIQKGNYQKRVGELLGDTAKEWIEEFAQELEGQGKHNTAEKLREAQGLFKNKYIVEEGNKKLQNESEKSKDEHKTEKTNKQNTEKGFLKTGDDLIADRFKKKGTQKSDGKNRTEASINQDINQDYEISQDLQQVINNDIDTQSIVSQIQEGLKQDLSSEKASNDILKNIDKLKNKFNETGNQNNSLKPETNFLNTELENIENNIKNIKNQTDSELVKEKIKDVFYEFNFNKKKK